MSRKVDFFISKFRENLKKEFLPGDYFRPRPYRNAAVRFRDCSIEEFEERRDILIGEAGLNPFLFRADKIPGCDLLSDSGTTTMTIQQWAAMLMGDEAYGSNQGYFEMKEQFGSTFGSGWMGGEGSGIVGDENLFIFHQGRAAENAFFSVLRRELQNRPEGTARALSNGLLEGLRERIESKISVNRRDTGADNRPFHIIPSNSHFDTTEGNIEDKMMIPLNMPCKEHIANNENFFFRGNLNTEELENLLENEPDRVPLIYLTITNNTGGGQPVSMANIREIHGIAERHRIPFFFDACRFAENAWFIQRNEEGYAVKEIGEIVHEMFEHVDGFHISLKKDGLVNIGGAMCIKSDSLFDSIFPHFREKLVDFQIMTEGHPTYGGLAGRDLKGISCGLRTVTGRDYLEARIGQVRRFAEKMSDSGIPVIKPAGGHAVYIDMDRFFDGAGESGEFMGIAFTALLLIAGHRVCELGTYAFGRFDGKREIPPEPRVNFVRAAVPRLTYEDQDLFSVVESIKILNEFRDKVPGVNVEYGRDLKLRHFKSRFSFKK